MPPLSGLRPMWGSISSRTGPRRPARAASGPGVGDTLNRVTAAIREAAGRADALILTGGIGPTQDDLTREALRDAAGVPMDFSEEYAERLRVWWERRGREMPATNLRQAEYPRGAEMIPNAKGTAPGLRLRIGGCWVFALPGVPQEMLAMVDEHVVPFLVAEAGEGAGVIVSHVLRTWGESESRIAELVGDLYEAHTNPTLAFLASGGEIKLRLTARAPTPARAGARDPPSAGAAGLRFRQRHHRPHRPRALRREGLDDRHRGVGDGRPRLGGFDRGARVLRRDEGRRRRLHRRGQGR